MIFFQDPKNWKQEISEIGLTAGFVLFLLSFLVLGNPSIWLLFSCVPLLVPLTFGSRLKVKLPALLLILISAGIIGNTIYWQRRPIGLNSPERATLPSSFAKASEDKPSEHRSKAQNAPREPQNKKTSDCGNNRRF